MKSEPKVFASLSSGLLARKGAARPAMRPQGFGQGGGALEDLGWDDMGFEPPKAATAPRDETHDAFGEELEEQPLRNPVAALTPVQSPVHSQQQEIAGRLNVPDEDLTEEGEEVDETAELYEPEAETAEPEAPEAETAEPPVVVELTPVRAPVARRVSAPRAAPGSKAKAAFTLRLDPDRHLKLRLACAISGRSAQLLVTDALDSLLGSMPELDAMAVKANRKG
ncbi:MAG: hypothetical protein ACR2KH_06370 [Sphingomicrobium sp.]